MRVIPNGFELPDLREIVALRDAARRELGIQPELIVVGIVARFDPTKDHESFLRAAAIIARRNSLVRFMLVGRGVDDRNDFLMRLVREGKLEGRCMLLGERREVQRFYAAMDVFCLCSVYEAFPLVLGEAMAMALPCVVTDAGDARRIVGGIGRVVPPRRPNELAEVLGEVIEMSPDDRRAVGLAARRRIEMEFSMSETRRLFEQAYLDACVESSD
jgi:glycosyltransferase involved in cell wall biosynthesis